MTTPLALTRPTRAIKRPRTYWDEYVATDKWYIKELVADVPPDEMQAALEDEDFSNDNEEDFPSEGEEDGDYAEQSEQSESDDGEEEEDLQWTSEGERSGEETDGESEGSTVG